MNWEGALEEITKVKDMIEQKVEIKPYRPLATE